MRQIASLEFEAILVLQLIFNLLVLFFFLVVGCVLVLMEGLEYLVLFLFILMLLPEQIIGLYYIIQQWHIMKESPKFNIVDDMIYYELFYCGCDNLK